MSLTARAIYEFMGTGTGQRRAYPKERKRQLSDEWKQRVRDRLAQLGHDHRWLEAEIGASRGMVTKMLAPRQNTSSLVDKVCVALSLEPPVTDATPEELRLVQGFRKMTADQRAHLLGLLGLMPRNEN